MSSIVVLEDIELIPVLKFEPFRFAAEGRSSPSGFYEDMREEWYRYWLEFPGQFRDHRVDAS